MEITVLNAVFITASIFFIPIIGVCALYWFADRYF